MKKRIAKKQLRVQTQVRVGDWLLVGKMCCNPSVQAETEQAYWCLRRHGILVPVKRCTGLNCGNYGAIPALIGDGETIHGLGAIKQKFGCK